MLVMRYTPVMSNRNTNTLDLEHMSDAELQATVDRARRVLAERKLRRQNKNVFVLDSRLIDGVRYIEALRPCGKWKSGKCKKCREGKFHGPYLTRFEWDGEKMVGKHLGPGRMEDLLAAKKPTAREAKREAEGAPVMVDRSLIEGVECERVGNTVIWRAQSPQQAAALEEATVGTLPDESAS
jgi:hypothetical protein